MVSGTDSDDHNRKEYASNKIIGSGYIGAQLSLVSNTSIVDLVKDSTIFPIISDKIVGVFTSIVEAKANSHFHENLSFLERHGILNINEKKRIGHERNVAMLKGSAALLGMFGIHAVIYSLDHYNKKRDFEKIVEAVAAGLAYVVRDYSLPVQGSLRRIYSSNYLDFDNNNTILVFQRHLESNISTLPTPKNYDGDALKDIFITILIASDLENPDVVQRCQDLGQLYGLKSNDIDALISACQNGTAVESSLSGIVAMSLDRLFEDIVKSIDYAKECARYVSDNDPYTSIREERRRLFMSGLSHTTEMFGGSMGMLELVKPSATEIIRKFLDADFSTYKVIKSRLSSMTSPA